MKRFSTLFFILALCFSPELAFGQSPVDTSKTRFDSLKNAKPYWQARYEILNQYSTPTTGPYIGLDKAPALFKIVPLGKGLRYVEEAGKGSIIISKPKE
jgi:hypothetical protein